ncbi:uncharacterized protein P174DRAFT_438173 [Aspergillus novofumigatus IBT 16806]|uniref:Uncharacterized protein n=1 Tax=Aspergillus novofumigatus (strain IBT 16806) TaxID=1392255 RepID=A0A2I1CFG8_ASPN1|nr:uncharacterized protein P174DRAFT_438173 [Aspergillus novofumigatus IBT 16806]PKX96377.1 hypothetical protein P174DRAFT_438173 [Aspergillus novofumigatus IBT 16806]
MSSPNPPSFRELRSTTPKRASPSAQTVFNTIVRQIPTITAFTEIVYEDVAPVDGDLITRSLAESAVVEQHNARINFNSVAKTLWVRVMPTELHDVHQRWVRFHSSEWRASGLLSRPEDKLLNIGVGTRFDGFTGQYTLSSKEPDLFLRPDSNDFPLIVMESGWSESWPRLRSDKDLWLNGSSQVNAVVLLKWSKTSNNRVKGIAEFWRRGAGGGLTVDKKMIFPAPNPAPAPGTDIIEFSRQDLFGQHILPGRNPTDMFPLDLEELRDFARERLTRLMGLTPA